MLFSPACPDLSRLPRASRRSGREPRRGRPASKASAPGRGTACRARRDGFERVPCRAPTACPDDRRVAGAFASLFRRWRLSAATFRCKSNWASAPEEASLFWGSERNMSRPGRELRHKSVLCDAASVHPDIRRAAEEVILRLPSKLFSPALPCLPAVAGLPRASRGASKGPAQRARRAPPVGARHVVPGALYREAQPGLGYIRGPTL